MKLKWFLFKYYILRIIKFYWKQDGIGIGFVEFDWEGRGGGGTQMLGASNRNSIPRKYLKNGILMEKFVY